MKVNYLLIDFENVQPQSLDLLKGHSFKIIIFLGANQTKISVSLAKSLQAFGGDVKYVQIAGNGHNALDFHIAFTLGELSKENQNADYHIISKDTGFDPLIKYLKTKGVKVRRSETISEIPQLRTANRQSTSTKIDVILNNLKRNEANRPQKVKTLKNVINSLSSKPLKDPDLMAIIQLLAQQGHIKLVGSKVSYTL